jgi:integrase
MKDLIDSADWIDHKAIFIFFAKTGIRRQELIDLDVQDLYLSKRYALRIKRKHLKTICYMYITATFLILKMM